MSQEQPPPPPPPPPRLYLGLSLKHWCFTIYGVIAVAYWAWNSTVGPERFRGVAFNFGKSLVWPFQAFPVLGRIGGILFLLVCIIVYVLAKQTPDHPDDRNH